MGPELVDWFASEIDDEDTDFDEQLLRLSHKIHTVLVDELGGQTFKADDRERLRDWRSSFVSALGRFSVSRIFCAGLIQGTCA